MKIQCSCGAKYNLEVTPQMRGQAIQFVCSNCGRDASEYVTSLVGRELDMAGVPAAPAPAVPAGFSNIAPPPPGYAPPAPGYTPPAPAAAATAAVLTEAPPPTPVASGSRLRIHAESRAPAPASIAAESAEAAEAPRCFKHGGEPATERCYVCSKPICPKCMELFGYLCSPLCKAKAEAQHIQVPVFEGQRSVMGARQARKSLYITLSVSAGIAVILGLWIWYAWFGSTPSKVYAVRFTEMAYSGETAMAGKNQLIFLHGAILARHDLNQKKEIWSRSLLDKDALDKEVADAVAANKAAADKTRSEDPDNEPGPIDPKKLLKVPEESAAAELQLRVIGQNVWVISPTKLTLYDWETGQPAKEIGLKDDAGSVTHRGDEVVVLSGSGPQQHATYINLATKEMREEDVTGLPAAPRNANNAQFAGAGGKGSNSKGGGLPSLSGKDADKPMDPAKVASDAQKLSIPGKMVLPAVLANSSHNQQIEKASKDGPDRPAGTQKHLVPEEPYLLVPTPDGFMRFTSKLLQENIVTRVAMKAPPAKSALNGDLNGTKTGAVANEILNEMQRNAGNDTVQEDESRYLVKLSSADGKNEWSGEVIGPPHLFPLQTVNVLASYQKIIVFDKQNKKLWDATLTYNVGGGFGDADALDSGVGKGPCVERNGRLYVFDQGVLTAFDLATGNAYWRVPSVGITGLFFDDKGMLYVNTTDASPESIKYSRQIDISQMPAGQLLKISPTDGKIIFKVSPPGPVTYVSGKFIYCVQSSAPSDDDDQDSILGMTGMGGTRPFIRIKRLNPSNGKEMWEHYESRGPLNIQFDKNQIRIVFRKEVEVLRFLSL